MYPSRAQALIMRIEDLNNRLSVLNDYTDEEFEFRSNWIRETHYSDEELASVEVDEIYFASEIQRAIRLARDELESIEPAEDTVNEKECKITQKELETPISVTAYRYLPEEDREIGKYYTRNLDIRKTAETFNVDTERVIRIVKDLVYHSCRTHCIRKNLREYL